MAPFLYRYCNLFTLLPAFDYAALENLIAALTSSVW